ncbi:transcriptional regulator CopG family [Candidatus Termititenax aidoneus]|uniref:Transcriptional regulator CopG family n=1 Tax=Termititenax aidoneus TaxID=2218524 RepID=A0A388TDM6_TERA1|nr:transcriptional regulator CopG family [Candidatus Termititenax aidoneus]
MATATVNISFQNNLLSQIDDVARSESRSRSELLREAARLYIERKQKWQNVFNLGEKLAAKNKLRESDVMKEIKSLRKHRS